MQAARTAEAAKHGAPRIDAAVQGHHPNGSCHVLVGKAHHARCGSEGGVPGRMTHGGAELCERVDRLASGKAQIAAERRLGGQSPENEIGVGDSRNLAALAIADGSRGCAG